MPITFAAYIVLALSILVSSFVSGVFGMAGGMILLGVLLNYFDVPSAMILFSIIQFCANGWRAWQWRRYVLWPIFWKYLLGAVIAFAAMYTVKFVPEQDDGLFQPRPDAVCDRGVAARLEAEYRMARRAIRHRRADHCHTGARRRWRAVSRYFLSEEHARPQDHQRHQGDGADARATLSASPISAPCPAWPTFRNGRWRRRSRWRSLRPR